MSLPPLGVLNVALVIVPYPIPNCHEVEVLGIELVVAARRELQQPLGETGIVPTLLGGVVHGGVA